MHARLKNSGYTIVEVMIFLAVSGLMFVIAAQFVSGKQTQAEFKDSVSSTNSKIDQVINDISNGYYPAPNSYLCQATAGGISISSGSNSQGSNQGCAFLGKVIQFGLKGTNGNGYNVYSVAGCQFNPCGTADLTPPFSFSEAKPLVVDDQNPAYSVTGVNMTEDLTLDWQASATAVYDIDPTGTFNNIGAIGFFASFANQNGSGLSSGSQSINVVPISNSSPLSSGGDDEKTMIADINTDLNGSPVIRTSPNIVICLNSNHGQVAEISIGGGNGQRLTTTTQISNAPIQLGSGKSCS